VSQPGWHSGPVFPERSAVRKLLEPTDSNLDVHRAILHVHATEPPAYGRRARPCDPDCGHSVRHRCAPIVRGKFFGLQMVCHRTRQWLWPAHEW
jgi:hypothetical protein